MRRLALPAPDGTLLREDLALLELLNGQIKEQEKRIGAENRADQQTELVQSVPGLGVILAAVIANEIDDISRFRDTEHLCAYAGLVPSTHGSGGHIYHGKLLWSANKWLRSRFHRRGVGCGGLLELLRSPI